MAPALYGANARTGGRAGIGRGFAGMLPPAGQIFENFYFLANFVNFGERVVPFKGCCLRRVRFLNNGISLRIVNFGEFFAPFKQGSSRGAASGGSDF